MMKHITINISDMEGGRIQTCDANLSVCFNQFQFGDFFKP